MPEELVQPCSFFTCVAFSGFASLAVTGATGENIDPGLEMSSAGAVKARRSEKGRQGNHGGVKSEGGKSLCRDPSVVNQSKNPQCSCEVLLEVTPNGRKEVKTHSTRGRLTTGKKDHKGVLRPSVTATQMNQDSPQSHDTISLKFDQHLLNPSNKLTNRWVKAPPLPQK